MLIIEVREKMKNLQNLSGPYDLDEMNQNLILYKHLKDMFDPLSSDLGIVVNETPN